MLSFKPAWSVCVRVCIYCNTCQSKHLSHGTNSQTCEPKLQVTALNYLSFKRSLGWHFAQSLVSRVWCWDTWSPASHVQLSHHGGCCSSSWLRCSPHPGKAPTWLQQFNNLHSFPKTSDSQLCRAYVYLCLLCAYLAWVKFSPSQATVLIHPLSLQQFKDIRRQHDLCKNGQRVSSAAQNAEVSSCSSEGSVTIPDLNVLHLVADNFM